MSIAFPSLPWMRRQLDRGENVLALQIRIVRKNLFHGGAGAEEFEDIGNPDSHPRDARATAALRVVDFNPPRKIRSRQAGSDTPSAPPVPFNATQDKAGCLS